MTRTPAFVLGIPRSGTTLLATLIGRHRAIHCPPEPWIMLALEAFGRTYPDHPCDAALLRTAVDDLLGDDRRKHLRAAALALYASVLDGRSEIILLDKTPRYHLIQPFLFDLFPDAGFVAITRNPLDIAASYKTTWQVDIARSVDARLLTPPVIDFLFGLRRIAEARHRPNVHAVSYEQLTSDPERVMTGVFRFLGLDIADVDDPFRWKASPDAAIHFGDPHIRQTNGVHTASVGTAKQVLSEAERATILKVLGSQLMSGLGYGDVFGASGVEADPALETFARDAGDFVASTMSGLPASAAKLRPPA